MYNRWGFPTTSPPHPHSQYLVLLIFVMGGHLCGILFSDVVKADLDLYPIDFFAHNVFELSETKCNLHILSPLLDNARKIGNKLANSFPFITLRKVGHSGSMPS